MISSIDTPIMDTLKIYKLLLGSGMTEDQAEAIVYLWWDAWNKRLDTERARVRLTEAGFTDRQAEASMWLTKEALPDAFVNPGDAISAAQ